MKLSKTLRFALSCAFLQATSAQDDIVLKTAIMEFPGFAERDADGNWAGIVIDVANALVEKAAADGVTLVIEIDTVNGVLSDTMTYNDALTTLDPDCTGDMCYDMILGNYFHTSERSQIVTFPQPYAIAYLTTFKTSAGAYNSLEEANAGGGSVCLPTGTAVVDSLSPITNTVVECDDNAGECIAMLKAGECDLWAGDNLQGAIITAEDPDIIGTGEVLLDIIWLTNALKSSLPPFVLQMMNKWQYEANIDAQTDFSAAYPETMTVSAGVIEVAPFAEIGDDGALTGYLADLVDVIQKQALEDAGTILTFDVDTGNPLNDLTYNGALDTLSSGCTGDACYDMILADYYHTADRSVLVTFIPTFLTTYLTSFKLPAGMYASFAEASTAGTVCLWLGTASYDALSPSVTSVVDCMDTDDCVAKLQSEECDLYVEDIRTTKIAIAGTDIECTEEVIGETTFVANPMASHLEPNMMVLLSKWYLDAASAGKFDMLEAKYFGGSSSTPPPTAAGVGSDVPTASPGAAATSPPTTAGGGSDVPTVSPGAPTGSPAPTSGAGATAILMGGLMSSALVFSLFN